MASHNRQLKLAKLEELRRAREGGKRIWKVSGMRRVSFPSIIWLILTFVQEEEVDLYDEVTEDQYKSIVRGRLQQDDFVVDDGVEGYMDNGMDDWMGGDNEDEESEGEIEMRKKSTCQAFILHLYRTNGIF